MSVFCLYSPPFSARGILFAAAVALIATAHTAPAAVAFGVIVIVQISFFRVRYNYCLFSAWRGFAVLFFIGWRCQYEEPKRELFPEVLHLKQMIANFGIGKEVRYMHTYIDEMCHVNE